MNEVIGRCIGETSLVNVSFISKKMPRVGEYVTMTYDGKKVLGMIDPGQGQCFPKRQHIRPPNY